jgi:dienelactone hydrolase
MVLVHGGGGKAFKDWATHWARRGYVVLAMDLSGNGPDGRLPDGGPDQSDQTKFRNFSDIEVKEMWTYHAVAAVIRGHSLLAAQPEVDPGRIGITGISWGGYLTCIVAGIDDRLKVAVPVYGCGFLDENSYWKDKSLAAMNAEARERWIKNFDPSQYLGGVNCPILFLNGSNDFAYPMDSYRKSYELVRRNLRTVSVIVRLKHGHYWEFREVDSFVDSVLVGGKPLAKLEALQITGSTATARVDSTVRLKKAELHYTSDSGEWQKRDWKTKGAEMNAGQISARLPAERPLVCYLSVTDERGTRVSTDHAELPAAK